MTSEKSSHREILRSTSIIGGATVGSLLIGLIKMKAIAALMGPAGVGLLGVFTALLTMGFGIFGMAVDTSGVRLLASSGEERACEARWALWSFALPLALLSASAFWLLQNPIARLALGHPEYAGRIRWIGLGVAATILSGAQVAIIQSERRMGDLARVKLSSAALAAAVSIAAIYYFSISGLIVAVLAAPIATMIAAGFYRGRSQTGLAAPSPPVGRLARDWKMLGTLGAAVTLAALAGSATQIAVRAILVQHLGLKEAGLFQASFAISALNLGLVLGAMIADYYPRLTAAAGESAAMNRIVNQQVHVGLVLAAPALLAISAAAPLLLSLLYTGEFAAAALLLRLQVAADAMRVAGWALGFVLLARAATVGYFLVEAVLGAIFVGLTWLMASRVGVASAGAAYLLGYGASVSLALILAARHGVRLDRSNWTGLGALVLALLAIAALSLLNAGAAFAFGLAAFAVVTYYSLREIVRIGFPTLPRPVVDFLARRLGWQEHA